MLKAREILRLKHQVGLSLREIGQSCNCGKTTVSETLKTGRESRYSMVHRANIPSFVSVTVIQKSN